MRKLLLLAVPALALTACGSDPVPGPTEQIVVREPGEAAPAVAMPTATSGDDAPDMLAAGEEAFASCVACHSIENGGTNGVGPNLFGIVGQKAGAVAGFNYSEAMKSSGITWTEAELDAFLKDPVAKVPGTTMATGIINDANKRGAIIAYLKTGSEDASAE